MNANFPPGSYLVNIEPEGEKGPGTHWCALRVCSDGMALYVDPAGYGPPAPMSAAFRRAGLRCLYANNKNQTSGDDCGARACFALETMRGSDASAQKAFREVLAPE